MTTRNHNSSNNNKNKTNRDNKMAVIAATLEALHIPASCGMCYKEYCPDESGDLKWLYDEEYDCSRLSNNAKRRVRRDRALQCALRRNASRHERSLRHQRANAGHEFAITAAYSKARGCHRALTGARDAWDETLDEFFRAIWPRKRKPNAFRYERNRNKKDELDL